VICIIPYRVELDYSYGEVKDDYNGDKFLVWWITIEKVSPKYVSSPTSNSIYN
jgi:hypothetical protein